jgi:ABC-type nickel/cobalt efflux system permease component RcnA
MSWQAVDASKEIKKANQFLASAAVSKMIGKASSPSEKAEILENRSNTTNAYIVNTTSYNVAEAVANAHVSAVSETNKGKMKISVVYLSINVILSAVNGGIIPAVLAMIIMTFCTYIKRFEVGILSCSLFFPTTFVMKVLSVMELWLEYINMRNKMIKYAKLALDTIVMLL